MSELILAIGYRVRSPCGAQFGQWASTRLNEFLPKGFVVDDEPADWDYFDELLDCKQDAMIAKNHLTPYEIYG